MDSGQDGDGLLRDIDAGEDGSGLRDAGESLGEDLRREMAQLEEDMILLGPDATAFANLNGHGPRNDITRSEILRCGGIAFHEALALAIEKISSLPTRTWDRIILAY